MFVTILTGALAKDAEIHKLDSGMCAISFDMAHNEKYTQNGEEKQKTTWIRCTLWRKADKAKIANFLKKGTCVDLTGTMSARAWVDKENKAQATLEFRVDTFNFGAGNKKDSSSSSGSGDYSPPATTVSKDDDELPF